MQRSKAVVLAALLMTGCAAKTVQVAVPIAVPVYVKTIPVESICEDSEANCIVL